MDWVDVNRNLFDSVGFERWVIFFVLLTMLVAAAFNVSSNLFLSVLQRYADISILKAMGFSRQDAVLAFGLHGMFFGVAGTGIGLFLGLAFCAVFELVQRWVVLLPADIYKIDHWGVTLRPQDLVAVVCASLLICVLATIAPALRASRLSPVEGLRYE
jgi:lipoprotein-releasing system permease protein